MGVPQRSKPMRRGFAPLLLLLLAGLAAVVAVVSYASTEPPLHWSMEGGPDVADKLRGMLAERKLSTTITEEELNALVKQSLYERRHLGEHVEITGANVTLSGDTLTVQTDVTLGGKLRLPLTHRLRLEWVKPDVTATHLTSSLKDVALPASWFPIGVIRVPLQWDERIPAEIENVGFEENVIRLTFRLTNPFQSLNIHLPLRSIPEFT